MYKIVFILFYGITLYADFFSYSKGLLNSFSAEDSLMSNSSVKKYINSRNCNQILDKGEFVICYDYKKKGALFVAYQLKSKHITKKSVQNRQSWFKLDMDIPRRYQSHHNDYKKAGYDRGHLASHASFSYSKSASEKTYIASNIVPMKKELNRPGGAWFKLEQIERKLAETKDILVINKVVYNTERSRRIGDNKIAIPISYNKMFVSDEGKECYTVDSKRKTREPTKDSKCKKFK